MCSQDIAAEYAAEKRDVVSMLQFDMVGYPLGNKPEIGLIDDYTSAEMTTFIAKLIDEYTSVGHTSSRCGYACRCELRECMRPLHSEIG